MTKNRAKYSHYFITSVSIWFFFFLEKICWILLFYYFSKGENDYYYVIAKKKMFRLTRPYAIRTLVHHSVLRFLHALHWTLISHCEDSAFSVIRNQINLNYQKGLRPVRHTLPATRILDKPTIPPHILLVGVWKFGAAVYRWQISTVGVHKLSFLGPPFKECSKFTMFLKFSFLRCVQLKIVSLRFPNSNFLVWCCAMRK